jgi:hypothetical protein
MRQTLVTAKSIVKIRERMPGSKRFFVNIALVRLLPHFRHALSLPKNAALAKRNVYL